MRQATEPASLLLRAFHTGSWQAAIFHDLAAIVRYLAALRGLSPAEAEQDVSSEIEAFRRAG